MTQTEQPYISGTQKDLLGKFLVAKKIVYPQTIDKALRLQKKGADKRAIGTILNRVYKIDIEKIDAAVCELIERLSERILKKHIQQYAAETDFDGQKIDAEILSRLISAVRVEILWSEISETRKIKKIDGQFVTNVKERGISNIGGEMEVHIGFLGIESEIGFTCKYDYLTEDSELRIRKADLISELKDDLFKAYNQLMEQRKKLLDTSEMLAKKITKK